MRTGRISLVPALDASVSAFTLNPANCRLDREHPAYLLRLASARARTSMDSSCLDYAAGIWIRCDSRCNDQTAPDEIGPSRPSGVEAHKRPVDQCNHHL